MICVKPHNNLLTNLRYLSTLPLYVDNDPRLPISDENSIDARLFHLRTQLQHCAAYNLLNPTRSCHTQIITLGLQQDTLTTNMLIKNYNRCGSLDNARQLFDQMSDRTLVTWNTMISGYTQSGHVKSALCLFTDMMKQRYPSEFTLSSVLCACAAQSSILECRQLHCVALKTSFSASSVYVGTALLDVYSKCNLISDAVLVFDGVSEKSDVTWSSMVAGYVRNELYEEALSLYRRSHVTGVKQNKFTISSALSACAGNAALIEGRQLHTMVCKVGLDGDLFVASSLVDVYSKCGCVREGYSVFCDHEEKNIVMWNALISGLARHGGSVGAMVLFEKMQQTGLMPNEVTYVSVLSACAHMGLVKEGRRYFELMVDEHNVRRNVVHYSCMVDLLGRSGLVKEAYEVIAGMPFAATGSLWGSLLMACRKFVNVELAEVAARKLFELEPGNAGNHVLLGETYAAGRQWGEVARSRRVLSELGGKEKGVSWIEVKGRVYTFMAGERKNARIREVYEKLEVLVGKARELGYEVKVECEYHDVEDGRKEELLRYHGEKLALAFGVMSLPDGVAVRIMKNLRICGDCHLFMRYASSVIGREIVVRDVNRFHHFRDGWCSCGDFW